MDLRKHLGKLLSLKFWGWAIVIVLLHIAVVLNLAHNFNDVPCKVFAYILKMELAKCNPIYSSIAIVVLLEFIAGVAAMVYFFCKYMKRKPSQGERKGDRKYKHRIIDMGEDCTNMTAV